MNAENARAGADGTRFPACRKHPCFSKSFLCFSRACLGEDDRFYHWNWRQKNAFFAHPVHGCELPQADVCAEEAAEDKERVDGELTVRDQDRCQPCLDRLIERLVGDSTTGHRIHVEIGMTEDHPAHRKHAESCNAYKDIVINTVLQHQYH
jgi:hypothetical protein